MRYKFILPILIFILSSCSSTVTFQPFTDHKYEPTEKVDLYVSEKPAKDYIEIGRIIVSEDAFTGETNMVKWAIEKARQVGANGLIWLKEEKDFYAIPFQQSVLAGDVKKIIFIAIKYRK